VIASPTSPCRLSVAGGPVPPPSCPLLRSLQHGRSEESKYKKPQPKALAVLGARNDKRGKSNRGPDYKGAGYARYLTQAQAAPVGQRLISAREQTMTGCQCFLGCKRAGWDVVWKFHEWSSYKAKLFCPLSIAASEHPVVRCKMAVDGILRRS
jgi:hypothetical protein